MKKRLRFMMLPFVATACFLVPHSGLAGAEHKVDSSVLGASTGYFHPYLGVAGVWDDNIYKKESQTVSDIATVISPGIWLAYPGVREKVINLSTSNMTPGGLGMQRARGKRFKRFQSYLHYRADLTRYASETTNNTDDQRVEGALQYNLRGGLSFSALDVFVDGHEGWADGISRQLDEFTSNLLGGRVAWRISPKFMLQGDYKYFLIDYDADRNAYRNRTDQIWSAYLFYALSSRTSFFSQYDNARVRYENFAALDSNEHHLFAGMHWKLSGKSTGEIKLGYLVKDYSDDEAPYRNSFIMQGLFDYRVTGRGVLNVKMARRSEEGDIYSRQNVMANILDLGYVHTVNQRLKLDGSVGYSRRTYHGLTVVEGVRGEREDDEYRAGIGVRYDFRRWLSLRADYRYVNRDSNFENLSYQDNRFLVRLSLSM